ncbi:MAG: 2TM domain-containing protein [Flavobacteriaceae bacterium]|nr:2TM domain-containing protein [Flavobacteriaceae bacterium]
MKQIDNSYEKARAQVKRLKGFYNHLFIYVIFLIVWFLFAENILGLLRDSVGHSDAGFYRWAGVNLWLNPLIWGVIVLIHGVYVFGFKPSFFKNWEERKIEEYMNEERTESNNRYE